MPIQKVNLVIWGKEFCMPVKCADSMEPRAFADVDHTIEDFIAHSADIMDQSIPEIRAYIEKAVRAIGAVAPENLFECISPQMLLVGHDEGSALMALLCGFAYDPEHDIAMVFRNSSLVEVGNQDLISWW